MKELEACQNKLAISTTGADLVKEFIEFIDVKPASAKTYKKAVVQFLRYLDAQNIRQPKRNDVIAWRESLKEKHAAATVQTYIIAVRKFFKWTSTTGYYPNIAESVKGAKVSKLHKRDYLTADQAKVFLENIDQSKKNGLRDYAIILLMISCGLRDIEVSRAKIGDLTTKAGHTILFLQGKGRDNKDEYIIIPATVEKAIRKYLATRNGITSDQALFTSTSNRNKSKALSTRTIGGIVKRELICAGFESKRLTAHSMRHTAATLALLGGCNIREVQQFLRHASINTTQIYAHDLDAISNKCSDVVANAIA